MFSRLASHVCPNGHRQEPTLNVAAEEPFACPTCGPNAKAQGAEELAFNSVGTCPSCEGSGIVREPSIGLRPSNIRGLQGVIAELLEEGNSVVMVDHDPLVLRDSDHLIEIGPGSGNDGGTVVATGTVGSLGENPDPLIGGFLTGRQEARACTPAAASHVFDQGGHQAARLPNHTVHTFDITIPRGRITAVTGVPASGMSTLVLDSLLPALRATDQARLPSHVTSIDTAGIEKAGVVDATPIGANVRSTVATYSGILDELRRAYAKLDSAKAAGLSARDFSYNTDSLRCPRCEGTGEITLDVQFLPDVDIACPDGGAAVTVPTQTATLFVFDEPTIGLHPLDVRVLIGVLQRLVDQGGTVVVIEHDLDVIANSDHVIDMGPDGGVDGGRIVVAGTPNQVADAKDSVTGQYLAKEASP